MHPQLESPQLRTNIARQQPNHQPIINMVLIPNPIFSTKPATREKINPVPTQTRTLCLRVQIPAPQLSQCWTLVPCNQLVLIRGACTSWLSTRAARLLGRTGVPVYTGLSLVLLVLLSRSCKQVCTMHKSPLSSGLSFHYCCGGNERNGLSRQPQMGTVPSPSLHKKADESCRSQHLRALKYRSLRIFSLCFWY